MWEQVLILNNKGRRRLDLCQLPAFRFFFYYFLSSAFINILERGYSCNLNMTLNVKDGSQFQN